MKFSLWRAALAAAAWLVLALPLEAATTTATVALTPTAYTDLGVGPMLLGANGGAVIYRVADSQPSAVSAGLVQQPGVFPALVPTTAHVWAIASNVGVNAVVSSGTGISSGGAAPGSPSFTTDVSRTSHAAVQCVLTVTNTATLMTALWATAGCPAFPAIPSYGFAYVMPTGGAVFQRTDAVTVTAANGWQIFQNQAWPVEGQLSIAGLQLIASGNVSTSVEVRY